MSARTDIVREALEGVFDAQEVRDGSTPDATLYAPGLGAEIKGNDAIAEFLAKLHATSNPKYTLEIEPVEHGDFVVAFAAAEIAGTAVHLCNVYHFDGDKISGVWALRG